MWVKTNSIANLKTPQSISVCDFLPKTQQKFTYNFI